MSEAPEATQHLEHYIFENVRVIHIPHAVSRFTQRLNYPENLHSMPQSVKYYYIAPTSNRGTKENPVYTNLFFGYHHP